MTSIPHVLIFDIDGTLVDTNYHHALAWYRAFRTYEKFVPVWKIHRRMGMGGDHVVADLLGDEVESKLGDEIRAAEKVLYRQLIEEVEPMGGARELIENLKKADHRIILASSAKAFEVDHYLNLLDIRDLVDGWTTGADVESTKPDPDLVLAALEKGGEDKQALMVGDSPFDCIAATRAGISTVAVLTGGFSPEELKEAGAVEVFETLEELGDYLMK
ncbi:MAG TPA: HAD family hydrolase [Actinomycetota bacterium]|nr:HAD family hydrolase [Actinomycetota bacterium]